MKIARNYFLAASFLIVGVVCSCGKKEGETDAVTLQMNRLTGTWKVSAARKEGVLQSGYENCKITLSGNAKEELYDYSITGVPAISPWTGIGTWKFGANAETQIVRDPSTSYAVNVDYVVSESALQLAFEYAVSAGRTESAGGYWIFTFAKE